MKSYNKILINILFIRAKLNLINIKSLIKRISILIFSLLKIRIVA